jgi:xylulose-5-phosphate/fructose-6-phosphate phosphoketolase
MDVIDRLPDLHVAGAHVKEKMHDMQIECSNYAYENGTDLPAADGWTWPY